MSISKSPLPSFSQWCQLPKILTKKEKIVLIGLVILFLSSGGFLAVNFYFKNTEIKPAFDGEHLEGVVGYPRFINPTYAAANDVDRDLIELIFSGLLKYNNQGQLIPDLAEKYEIKEDGKIFEFQIKENILWHDNKKFTVDDIIFTIKTIQNPDYKSPLRPDWLGVEVEKIDERKVRFKLKNPYSSFLERLTLKIIPQHIWQNISPENFPLATYNLQPIGTGPYKFKELKLNQKGIITGFASISLEAFKNYFGKKPFLERIIFLFFDTQEALIQAANKQEIKGLAVSYPIDFDWKPSSIGLNEYIYSLPRYFSVFLNPDKSDFFKKTEVRQALNYATNKIELVEKTLYGKGKVVLSPILPEVYGFLQPSSTYEYNPKKAEELLKKAGLEKREGKFVKVIKKQIFEFKSRLTLGSKGEEVRQLQTCLSKDPEVYPEGEKTGYFGPATKKAVIKFQEKYAEEILKPLGYKQGTGTVGDSTRVKLNEICGGAEEEIQSLILSLTTVEDPLLKETAQLLKKQWEDLGIEVKINIPQIPSSQFENDFIKLREYDCLLFGEVLGIIPDPFPFWHSSQKKDPGLNLSKYENKKVDELLVKARTTMDAEIRQELYQKFQNILLEDAPAVFLYSPDYIYFVSAEIKGIDSGLISDPSKRFAGIENWYIKTKRGWK